MTRDTWIGVVFLAFSVLYWTQADKIRVSPLDDPVTAAGMPKSLAFALGGLAVLLILRSLYMSRLAARADRKPADKVEETDSRETWKRHLRALGMLGLGVAYLLVVPYLGYVLSVIGLMLAVSLYIGARFGLKTLAVAGLGGGFFYLLFVQFLNIPLPPGLWPSLLQSLQG